MSNDAEGLTGRIIRWTRNGYSWNGEVKGRTFRRGPTMRAWVCQGFSEATEEPYKPEEEGLYLGAVIRVSGYPEENVKLGATMHIPGVFDRDAVIPHLATMERALEKSLMFYDLLGATENVAELGREKFGSEEAFVAACDDWRRRHEWTE